MGAHWSRYLNDTGSSVSASQSSALAEKSSDKTIEKVQRLVLEQYPYLETVRESILITDLSKPDCPIIYANDDFEKMTLYPKEEIVGRNCRFLQGAHTNPETVNSIREAVHAGKGVEIEILNYRSDGVAFWNHFLMLPVFKNKKCRYFIAIQKNVTTIKASTNVKKWTPAEVAMWLEHHTNNRKFSQRIIAREVNGTQFLRMDSARALKLGILLRSEQSELIKSAEWLKEHLDCPFTRSADSLGVYKPVLDNKGVNTDINRSEPSELAYWDRDDSERDTILFKAYYRDKIFMFLWPRDTAELEIVETEICVHFDIKHARLTHINFRTKQSTVVYTSQEFHNILKDQKGTIRFFVEEEEKDLLSLTSLLYTMPDPILVVNGLLHVLYSNAIANDLFEVKGANSLPNATQLLPELPVDFAQSPLIRTILIVPQGPISVEISVTCRSESVFLFIIRPIGFFREARMTESFSASVGAAERTSFHKIHRPSTGPDPCKPFDRSSLSGPMLQDPPDEDSESSEDMPTTEADKGSDEPTIKEKPPSPELSRVKAPTMREGDKTELANTLDQVLFAADASMMRAFIFSFKMFHTKETVLSSLEEFTDYYFSAETQSCSDRADLFANLNRNFGSMLELWLMNYPDDFGAKQFRTRFIDLIDRFPNDVGMNTIRLRLLKGAKQLKVNQSATLVQQFTVNMLATTPSKDIANALTMHDLVIFRRIQVSEFYHCNWTKEEKKDSLAPNLTQLAASFERITQWIAACILVKSSKERARRIHKLISVAQRLLRMNNFHTMMAVISGLSLNAVSRLKQSWTRVPGPAITLFEDIRTLMDSRNNFAQYRKALNDVIDHGTEFGVPYVPVVLRDLMYINEVLTDDCTPDNITMIGKQLSIICILQHRSVPEDLTANDSLLHFFSTMSPTSDEDLLYEKSIELEPIDASTSSPMLKSRSRSSNNVTTNTLAKLTSVGRN